MKKKLIYAEMVKVLRYTHLPKRISKFSKKKKKTVFLVYNWDSQYFYILKKKVKLATRKPYPLFCQFFHENHQILRGFFKLILSFFCKKIPPKNRT